MRRVRHLRPSVPGLVLAPLLAALIAGVGSPGAGAAAFSSAPCPLSAAGAPKPNEAPVAHPRFLSGTGTLSAAMVFVDFSDAPGGGESPAGLAAGIVPEAQSWFAGASSGRFGLAVTEGTAWIRMPKPASAYSLATVAGQRAYMADAVAAADAAHVELGGDRAVLVVPSRGVPFAVSSAFSHAPAEGVRVPSTGQEIDGGVTFGADVRTALPGYGAHLLEQDTLHLLGLPDLYDPTATSDQQRYASVGGWDPMSYLVSTVAPLAWHQELLGWLDPSQMPCAQRPQTVSLTPLEQPGGVKAIEVPTGRSSAYVIEDRQPQGTDRSLCSAGALVYAVDAAAPSGQAPIVVRPAQPGAAAGCAPLSRAPFTAVAGNCRFSDQSAGLTVEVLSARNGTLAVSLRRPNAGDATPGACGRATRGPGLALAAPRGVQRPLLARALRVVVSCSQACELRARADLLSGGSNRRLARTTGRSDAGASTTLSLPLRGAALRALGRALGRHRSARVRVTVTARERGGSVRSAVLVLRLGA